MKRLLGAVVISAFWQLFEGHGSGAYASPISPIHQPEICTAGNLINVAVSDRAIDIDGRFTICDRRLFLRGKCPAHSDWSEVYSPSGAKDGAGIAGLYGTGANSILNYEDAAVRVAGIPIYNVGPVFDLGDKMHGVWQSLRERALWGDITIWGQSPTLMAAGPRKPLPREFWEHNMIGVGSAVLNERAVPSKEYTRTWYNKAQIEKYWPPKN
jgi:hypothetical protein